MKRQAIVQAVRDSRRNRAALGAALACAGFGGLPPVALAAPVAHCMLEGGATISAGALTSTGTSSCTGIMAQTTVVPSQLRYTLRGTVRGLGSSCNPLGGFVGDLVFHARQMVSFWEPSDVTAKAGIVIAGGRSGVLTGSGDDGVDGIGLGGSAVFTPGAECGAGVLRMTFEVVGNGRPPAASDPEPQPQGERPPPRSSDPAPRRATKRSQRRSRRGTRCRRRGRHASRPARRCPHQRRSWRR